MGASDAGEGQDGNPPTMREETSLLLQQLVVLVPVHSRAEQGRAESCCARERVRVCVSPGVPWAGTGTRDGTGWGDAWDAWQMCSLWRAVTR